MKAVVVGIDHYRYIGANGEIAEAERGQEIDVSEDEFNRVPGALAKPGSKAAKAAAAAGDQPDVTPTGYPTSQEELDKLAEKNDFSFDQHVRTPGEKIKALEEAGIEP